MKLEHDREIKAEIARREVIITQSKAIEIQNNSLTEQKKYDKENIESLKIDISNTLKENNKLKAQSDKDKKKIKELRDKIKKS